MLISSVDYTMQKQILKCVQPSSLSTPPFHLDHSFVNKPFLFIYLTDVLLKQHMGHTVRQRPWSHRQRSDQRQCQVPACLSEGECHTTVSCVPVTSQGSPPLFNSSRSNSIQLTQSRLSVCLQRNVKTDFNRCYQNFLKKYHGILWSTLEYHG